MTTPEVFLDAVALGGSPGQAYASHRARAAGIARYFASTRPLDFSGKTADENTTVALIAHLHAASLDPGFTPDGQSAPSAQLAPQTLMSMNKGAGTVGTRGIAYDFALKGLAVLAYRYSHLLGPDGVSYILNQLVPGDILGPHNPDDDGYSIVGIDVPETENHLLMIESSRYLFNQLFHDLRADDNYDNNKNGLTGWLLSFLQQSAMHDFMEFSARPYARLTLHVLLNLYEFARDQPIRTAAQILLDYTMVKCALSSSRQRRVNPYRRHQEVINHQANSRNYLFSSTGDQVNLFFLAYTGATDPQGTPSAFLPDAAFCGLIAGTSSYRPPPAAYILALQHDVPPGLHVFYHGVRPRLNERCSENAEGGLEIYFKSPSFLLSAGGNFLNSGYGKDELSLPGKSAWEQTSRAQATTLIPAKADVLFDDLVRLEPWPDPPEEPSSVGGDPEMFHTLAVNTGVGAGIACGTNLRPAEKKIVWEAKASGGPCLGAGPGQLYVGRRLPLVSALTVAQVQHTAVFGVDGVEGITGSVALGQSSDGSPALAVLDPWVVLAWRGSGNTQLNVAVSTDGGVTFPAVTTLADSSDFGPALAVHNGTLFISWAGSGSQINVAQLTLVGNTSGAPLRAELDGKIVLSATTDAPPALASADGLLFLAWRGAGNSQLNAAYSQDNGQSFTGTATFTDASDQSPALAAHNGNLFMAWAGLDHQINVAQLVLLGNTSGTALHLELDGKITLGESTGATPALASYNGLLFLAWTGDGAYLNLRCSRDGTFGPLGPWIFFDGTAFGFFAAAYRTPATVAVDGDEFDTSGEWTIKPLENLAIVYAMEAPPAGPGALTFGDFCTRITQLNASLPPALQYNSTYEFRTPDGKQFSCWFKSTEQKYQARIIDLSEASPTHDLSTLPLVSGPFMTCPGGHDGLIQIRPPGCAQPIVLDFRTASPIRTDNVAACPQPWIDRTLALVAIAQKFDGQARVGDLLAALADAAQLYGELVTMNSGGNGPPLAPAVITALGVIGVDFSVPVAQLRDWLTNPQFTPYPSLTQALLLQGWRLAEPVYIDVISAKYEGTPGVPSPRAVANVRLDVLKAAVLASSNERHETHETMFEHLLKS